MWMRNSARSSFLQELPQFPLQRCMGRKTPWSRFQHFRNSHRDHSTSRSFLNFPITAQRFRLPPQTWWCCASRQQAVTGWILFITCVAPRRYKQYFLSDWPGSAVWFPLDHFDMPERDSHASNSRGKILQPGGSFYNIASKSRWVDMLVPLNTFVAQLKM